MNKVLLKKWWLKVILVFSLGIGRAEQQLSPDLSFVIQTYGPNFRPAVTSFWYILVRGCCCSCCYRGKTKSTPRLKSWSRSGV